LEFTWTSRNGVGGGADAGGEYAGSAECVRRPVLRRDKNLRWTIPKAVSSGADEEEHLSCPCRDETGVL